MARRMWRVVGRVLGVLSLAGAGLAACSGPGEPTSDEPVRNTSEAIVVSGATEFQPNVTWGGRVQSVDAHPATPTTAIAASDGGGLFRTTDGGANWTHLDGLRPSEPMDVGYSPMNPAIVLATALPNSRLFAAPGDTTPANDGGIWRSTDGGTTWQRPAGFVPANAAGVAQVRHAAYEIAFEAGTNNVYVGTDFGVAVSTDSGANFVHRRPVTGADVPVQSVFAQNGIIDIVATDGHHRSTDGGNTWTNDTGAGASASTLPGQVERGYGLYSDHAITRSPLENDVIFAVTLSGGSFEVFESDDAGGNWTALGLAGILGRPAFVTVSPSYMAGGVASFDLYASDGIDMKRQTCTMSSGGTTSCTPGGWTYINLRPGCAGQGPGCGGTPDTCPESGGPCAHNDVTDLVFDPTNSTTCPTDGRPVPLYLVGDGGVEVTSDCGITWGVTGGGTGGFNALQVLQMTGQTHAAGTPSHLYFGTQDTDVWASPDGGSTWPRQIPFEGYDLETPHFLAAPAAGLAITGVTCGPCSAFARNVDLSASQPITTPPSVQVSCPDTDNNGLCDAAVPPCMMVGGNQQCQAGCIDNDGDTTCDGVPCRDLDANNLCDPSGLNPTLQLRTPKVIADGVFVEYSSQGTLDSTGASQINLYLSNDYGATWNPIPGANVPVTNLSQGTNLIAGPANDPTLYTMDSTRVMRVRSLLGPGNTPGTANVANVTPPAATGTLAYYGVSTFIRRPFPAIGADPKDGDRVIMALTNGSVASTSNGGQIWTTTGGAQQLAQLATANGTFAVTSSQIGLGMSGIPASIVQSQIFSIAFDQNSQTVLAGTLDAGVLASEDNGASWARVCGTNAIPRVTTFFFDETVPAVYASSYGRGLWQLDLTQRQVPEFTTPPSDVTVNDCRVDIGQAVAVDSCEGLPVSVVPDPDAMPGDPTYGCQNPAIRPCGNFPIGSTTTITWVATDAAGGESTATSTVTVGADTTGPAFSIVPPDIVTSKCTGISVGQAFAEDSCGGGVTIVNDAPATFPLGVTTVTWTATDARGNTSTATQKVTVLLGDDPSCCPAGTHVIVGSSNNDFLNGTNGSDCIIGGGAQDTINGNGGDDYISGGDGDDVINGGSGNDMLFGGSGQDTINGNTGADTVFGGDGDDSLLGGLGADELWGGQGQDSLQGQGDNDRLFGGIGDDNLQGGDGNDDLAGGPGGQGHDTCADTVGMNTFAQCEFGGVPDTCADSLQNGTETGVDCGGGCLPCTDSGTCAFGGDCLGNVCSSGVCQLLFGGVGVIPVVETDWGYGYCVHLSVANTEDIPTVDWSTMLDTNMTTIFTSWNATFSGSSGAITVTPDLDDNQVIGPTTTDNSIGFCANRSSPNGNLPFVTSAMASY